MKDKYKVVIVGFAHVHINDVAKHFYEHPRIDLCGAADVPPHMPEMKPGAIYTREWNIDYCCKNYNIPKFDDWKQMLDEVKPDLCVVNSENCYHVQITEECAKRGIGVSIEKPMATTMSDAMKMYRIVGKCIASTSPGFIVLHIPLFAFLTAIHIYSYCIRKKAKLLSTCCHRRISVVRPFGAENPSQKISSFDRFSNASRFL